jgi:antirestriction protein ArdC
MPQLSEAERIARAEAFFAAIPAEVRHGGNRCYYDPAADRVQMVPFDRFESASAYYGVLAHELTHWTGAPSRLARDLSGRFGSEAYAMEELVAELGAAFTGGQLGLPIEPRRDHAPYIASWLKVLKGDGRAIFTAAGKAQEAMDYMSFPAPVARG